MWNELEDVMKLQETHPSVQCSISWEGKFSNCSPRPNSYK